MSEEQKELRLNDVLAADVHESYISERSGLSYVTGRYVKQTLNTLFGPLGWSYEVIKCEDKSTAEAARFFVHVRLSVTVEGHTVTKDGLAVGHGLLVGRNGPVSPGRANEVYDFAAAEGVTDALKRAATSLGQVLGLSLYPLTAGGKQAPAAPKTSKPKTEKKASGFKKPKSF